MLTLLHHNHEPNSFKWYDLESPNAISDWQLLPAEKQWGSWNVIALYPGTASPNRHFFSFLKSQVQVTMICLFSLSLSLYLCIYLSMYPSAMTMSSGVFLAAVCFCGRKGDALVRTWPASEWTLPPSPLRKDPRTVRQTLNHSLQLYFWFHVDLSFLVIVPPKEM